jgi:AcrR family transcriptional regulator
MKGFSDAERDRIREGLIEAGREQFSAFGHDRTRISDLTDAVDIATSTFYQFFDSKEALYLEILGREQSRMADELEGILNDAPDLRSEVSAGLEYFFEELETNPLYYRLIVEDDIRPLHVEASEAGLEAYYEEQFRMFEPHAERWTDDDTFRIDDPEELVGLFRLLSFTVVAKETFEGVGPSRLDEAHGALVASLVDGLFVE